MSRLLACLFIASGLALGGSMAYGQARVLAVPLVEQQHSQWCWAASSQAVLNYYRQMPTQCSLVNWAFNRRDACGSSVFNWNSSANSPNNLTSSRGSVQGILQAYSIRNFAVYDYLSWAHVQSDVDAGRPFVIRWGWRSGGGHILLGRGYDVTNGGERYLYVMNPWPGEGLQYQLYDYVVGARNHSWTHSLRMQQ